MNTQMVGFQAQDMVVAGSPPGRHDGSCGQKSARISNCIGLRISLYVGMSLGQDKLQQHHVVLCLLEHGGMAQMLHHVTMPDQMLIRW